MATASHTDEVLQATVDAVAKYGNQAAAALALSVKEPTFRSRYKSAISRGFQSGVIRTPSEKAKPEQRIHDYESAWEAWKTFIGQTKERYRGPKRKESGERKKIVIVSDLHVPFHEPEMVADVIARDSDADLLIINGDLQDFYSISRFTKYETVPIERELAEVQMVLERLSEAFPRVLIVEGNHDRPRFEKQLRTHLATEPDVIKVIEYLTGGNLSPIRLMASKLPNVKMAEHRVGPHSIGWFAQEGDLLVCHAEKFSITPGAALRKIDEWFEDMRDHLGLDDWRVCIQAHTHQLGFFPWKSDRVLLEGGCLCKQHGYQLQPRIGGRPQRRGYVTLEQIDGVTDINSIRLPWLDVARTAA